MVSRATKLSRDVLRRAASIGLQRAGYRVGQAPGSQGVAAGSRLIATNCEGTFSVAVRTSPSRKITLMRTENGKWRTIKEGGLVVVAVPADRISSAIEVFGFKSEVV